MITKVCKDCGLSKKIQEFYIDNTKKDRIDCYCKLCRCTQTKKYYSKNRKKVLLKQKIYDFKNKEEREIKRKKYALENREKMLAYSKKQYLKHKNNTKLYYLKHKDKIQQKNKEWSLKNKKRIATYNRLKYKQDINFKLSNILRTRFSTALRLKNIKKEKHTLKLIGCSIKYLKTHLEEQFQEGMTWGNYGVHGWHIDHIKPCTSFDLTDPKQQKQCFHYSNLQPLWAKENLSKNNKYNWEKGNEKIKVLSNLIPII